MTTTNETMKVITDGIDKKEGEGVVMGGKVIAVEVPDEMADILEGMISSLLSQGSCADAEESDSDPNSIRDPEDDHEFTETEELALRIIDMLAYRASNNLMKIARRLSTDSMLAIVKCIEEQDSEGQVFTLKAVFLSCGMNEAADELRFLDICSDYLDDAAFFFEEAFFDTDSMDWYSIENLLREKARAQNRKLN